MKICKVPGCENKHHAKGYCSKHYNQYILVPSLENTKCCVVGCQNKISPRFTGKKLCEMHGTRLKRNGNIEVRQRKRDAKNLIVDVLNSESPLDYEFLNHNSFVEMSKTYYDNYCRECGWNKGNCEVHHIIPIEKGGKHTLRNAILLCPNCHRLKHDRYNKKFVPKYDAELVEKLKRIKR